MPIYEYRCEKCGDFERMQRITEAALERCPTCRRKVTRLISSTSFQLKGTGWYVTDYARSGSGNGSKKGADGKSDSSSESSSESKPAPSESKAESKAESKSESKTAGTSSGTSSAKTGS